MCVYVDDVENGGVTHTLIVYRTRLQSNEACPAWLRERAFPRLTSRDPTHFWTSGQWMTERQGGSDVGTSRRSLPLNHWFPSFILSFYLLFFSLLSSPAPLSGRDSNLCTPTVRRFLSLAWLQMVHLSHRCQHGVHSSPGCGRRWQCGRGKFICGQAAVFLMHHTLSFPSLSLSPSFSLSLSFLPLSGNTGPLSVLPGVAE